MLLIEPHTYTHSHTHSIITAHTFTHTLTHTHTHTHSHIHSLTHSLTHIHTHSLVHLQCRNTVYKVMSLTNTHTFLNACLLHFYTPNTAVDIRIWGDVCCDLSSQQPNNSWVNLIASSKWEARVGCLWSLDHLPVQLERMPSASMSWLTPALLESVNCTFFNTLQLEMNYDKTGSCTD